MAHTLGDAVVLLRGSAQDMAAGTPRKEGKGLPGSFWGGFQSLPVSQECSDRCCNATTCQLREGAECARGDCCQDCKVLPPWGPGGSILPRALLELPISARCVPSLEDLCSSLLRAKGTQWFRGGSRFPHDALAA